MESMEYETLHRIIPFLTLSNDFVLFLSSAITFPIFLLSTVNASDQLNQQI
jgi:hypothetical protein